ncbi:hypothetical protein PUNSTDRAFT_64302 [Punctularia strigosozonata HHB-11173 SS5]|uniref:uncharacterized protein n=1 Tax=Punctularia strigosozonata (strain HHB-11173) TaxID=741275 RepID=UPI0004416AF7|nr:uncharacterized protein PUNSTDRAFT_64302 [Punctularia strigosozonata HHB-11173 SS5]EIN11100.1 hypothetical protein PUNSTDRAFT_64302 [Punctularia strigosozonata HHB-11173 SS5]
MPSFAELDLEYRFWSFMEGHPAHAPLPPTARDEALDVLTWAYTGIDCLLPTNRLATPPFTPEECQELMGLLKQTNTSVLQPAVQTRIVSRILLRGAQWRQLAFRPNRALPKDVPKPGPQRVERHVPLRRAVLDIAVSFLCLGIPFLFMGRSHQSRFDLERGFAMGSVPVMSLRSPGPAMVVAGTSCLVAAMILSASVTFISLPGLDDLSRIAGLLAILCSTASMASTVIALFRYKTDVERSAQYYMAGEGLVVLTRRSIVMSLPLVFLAWAVAAFITGVTMYSFRGFTLTAPGSGVYKQPFDKYTQWTIAGTLGGLVGVLVTSVLLVR